MRLLTASPTEIAGLYAAVRPVYAQLERDPLERKAIREIGRLRTDVITTVCPRDVSCARGSIETFTWSVYRGRLSLDPVSGGFSYPGLIARPLTRAG